MSYIHVHVHVAGMCILLSKACKNGYQKLTRLLITPYLKIVITYEVFGLWENITNQKISLAVSTSLDDRKHWEDVKVTILYLR